MNNHLLACIGSSKTVSKNYNLLFCNTDLEINLEDISLRHLLNNNKIDYFLEVKFSANSFHISQIGLEVSFIYNFQENVAILPLSNVKTITDNRDIFVNTNYHLHGNYIDKNAIILYRVHTVYYIYIPIFFDTIIKSITLSAKV